jgi:hypothetical protein
MTATTSSDVPRAEYSRRLAAVSQQHANLQTRERRAGYAQLAIAVMTVGWVIVRVRHFSALDFLILLPVAAFVVLAFMHSALLRKVALSARGIVFYQHGLARLNDTWAGTGVAGERFLPPAHPCARDLDLFGRASVFELLCTARTRAGEEALAAWLLAPAAPVEVRLRQAAARELSQRVDFREKLSTLGEDVNLGVRPPQLIAWGQARDVLPAGFLRFLAPLLAVLWIVTVIAWQLGDAPRWLAFAVTLVNLSLSYRYRAHLDEAAHEAENAGHDLKLLSEVLTVFEREPFTSPRLLQLQAQLQQPGMPPSRAIVRLNRIVEFLESAHNLFVRVFDYVIFYRLQSLLAAERWRRRFGAGLPVWLAAIGELEALAAIAGYAYEHPDDVFPEFVEQAPYFAAEGLAHPLLPRDRAIANDLHLDAQLQLLMVSGPNMAGKSTFLRGIGVNAVLAQCGAPVRATSLKLSPLAVTASICVLDSLEGGISRFYAEIHRLKQIMDLTREEVPVLFLFDELLSGTNSHDRLLGTRSILTRLVARGAVGLVSTHDLALTAIPDEIGDHAINCHFEDHLEEEKLVFDYKLYPGIVQTSNALPLMRSIGLEV